MLLLLTKIFNAVAIVEQVIPLATKVVDYMIAQRDAARRRTNPPFKVKGPKRH